MTTQTQQAHAIDWFEIPVTNIDRAQAFYERILGKALRRESMEGSQLAVFPSDKEGVAGALFAGGAAPKPVDGGTVVYLNAEPSLDAVLARVEAAGGQIATPRTELPAGMGCFAHVKDLDGNRVGLHAMA
jgi:predicted enzyme related to lactoylglutathione lyase